MTNQISGLMKEHIYQFFFKMFASFQFKLNIGLSYIANLSKLVRISEEGNTLRSLGVQILTIEELVVRICQNPALVSCITETLDQTISEFV